MKQMSNFLYPTFPKEGKGDYEIVSVRLSIRLSVCLSICPSIHPDLADTVTPQPLGQCTPFKFYWTILACRRATAKSFTCWIAHSCWADTCRQGTTLTHPCVYRCFIEILHNALCNISKWLADWEIRYRQKGFCGIFFLVVWLFKMHLRWTFLIAQGSKIIWFQLH